MDAALRLVDSITSLFTPIILFCIVNLVIGTIFIASRLKSHEKPDPAASSSAPTQNQLVRVPSFLDRVKSFNFSSYVSEQPDPFHAETQKPDPREEQEQEPKRGAEEGVLLESHHHDDQAMKSKSAAPAANGGPAKRMKKSVSEKVMAGLVDQEKVDRRRAATVRERERRSWRETETETETLGGEEAVDKKADDFINRFRQQLKLQRSDSILRYKEMLNRGLGLES